MVPEKEFQANAQFIRRLAGRLVADPQGADDVAQETWLTAMEKPPRKGGSIRGWLRTVMLNIVRQKKRSERRRVRRETIAARPESEPAPVSLFEREQSLRRLTDAVLELPENYRQVLLLHFYEELSHREIAERLGITLENARSRYKRGIEKLRSALDGKYGGDRSAWCLGLASLSGLKWGGPATVATTVAAASAATGAILMSMKAKLIAAGLIVAGTSFSIWLASSDSKPDKGMQVAAASMKEDRHDTDSAADFPVAGNREGETGGGSIPERTTEGGERKALGQAIVGRDMVLSVVWQDGQAIPGAEILISRNQTILDQSETDSEGKAKIMTLTKEAECLVLGQSFPPHRATLSPGPRNQKIVVPQGASVSGRIFINGQVPDQAISLTLLSDAALFQRRDFTREEWQDQIVSAYAASVDQEAIDRLQTQTDGSGQFRFDGLPSNWRGKIEVGGDYFFPDESDEFEVTVYRHKRLDRPMTGLNWNLSLMPVLSGQIVEPDGITPVAGAVISFRSVSRRGGTTIANTSDRRAGEDGSFKLQPYDTYPTTMSLQISRPDGTGTRVFDLGESFQPGINDLGQLQVVDEILIPFVVNDVRGNPVPTAVAIFPGQSFKSSKPTDGAGRGEIEVPPDTRSLTFAAVGYRVEAFPVPANLSGSLQVTLAPSNYLQIRIDSREKDPDKKFRLQIIPEDPLWKDLDEGNPLPFLGHAGGSSFRSWTTGYEDGQYKAQVNFGPDAEGKVTLSNLSAEVPFRAILQDANELVIEEKWIPGLGLTERRELSFQVSKPLGKLEGVVRNAEGLPLSDAEVSIQGHKDFGGEFTNAEGRFIFLGIYPDTVHLVVKKKGYHPFSQPGFSIPSNQGKASITLIPK